MKQSSVWWQYVLPKQLLSRLMGFFAHCRCSWLKNWAITAFSQRYGVNLKEALIENGREYASFNAFFTRQLKPGARLMATDPFVIVSPVDGCVSQVGRLDQQQILQAKGKYYSLNSLLGGDPTLVTPFVGGSFMTAYLAPKDYHRIHMPLDGRLVRMDYVPGNLFSVNEASVTHIDQLFARNERVVCLFDSPAGPFAVILVGALIVGSIVTAWHGVVNTPRSKKITTWDYRQRSMDFGRGDELGYFQLGSTVIVLFPKDRVIWQEYVAAGASLSMGSAIAKAF